MATHPTPSSLSSQKKATFLALGLLTLAGCGPLFQLPNPPFKWDVDASAADAGQASAVVTHAQDDAWASGAFALYGQDAVHTCLAAFRQDVSPGELEAAGQDYRASLADFMCSCARGQSAQACPEP
jgi:hypothetical protein